MVRINFACYAEFRTIFKYPPKNVLNWFPGHMDRGMKQMQAKLKSVDCVVEVHDARIPLSGRNQNFKFKISGIKPHVLVFNKKDLADLTDKHLLEERFKREGVSRVIFTNCKDSTDNGIREVVPTVKELVAHSDRFNRAENPEFALMVIGVPNVGKSSLINALRGIHLKRSKAAAVGAIAGITRSVATRIKISDVPPIYLLDTPGILNPQISDIDSGLKLALCSSMQDHLVGVKVIADYLLFWLNKKKNFHYVDYLGLKEPLDLIDEVLLLSAVNLGKTVKKRSLASGGYVLHPDVETAAAYFIAGFRSGKFGQIMLDDVT